MICCKWMCKYFLCVCNTKFVTRTWPHDFYRREFLIDVFLPLVPWVTCVTMSTPFVASTSVWYSVLRPKRATVGCNILLQIIEQPLDKNKISTIVDFYVSNLGFNFIGIHIFFQEFFSTIDDSLMWCNTLFDSLKMHILWSCHIPTYSCNSLKMP